MKALTLNLGEDLFVPSHEGANQLGKTLNQYLVDLLAESVSGETDPLEDMLGLKDKFHFRSDLGPFTREEAHDCA